MDIEKLLDQLLMPPPATSFNPFNNADTSGSSLDQSHGSSGTFSSGNSSWLSESSCGCHSPRSSVNPKSSLIFHRNPILPPLLCSAARTEMQVYKTKAVERERKRRQKSRSQLISRVEAILSSVDTDTSVSPPSSHDNSPKAQVGIPTCNNESVEPTNESIDHLTTVVDSVDGTVDLSHEGDVTPKSSDITDEMESNTNAPPISENSTQDLKSPDASSSSSDDEEESFQEDAYRRSLQNLLQKSMTLDTTLSEDTVSTSEKPKPAIVHRASSTPSTSSLGNTWADNTFATVIPNTDDSRVIKNDSSSCASLSSTNQSVSKRSSTSSSVEEDLSGMNATADELVDSVLEGVRRELVEYASHKVSSDEQHPDPAPNLSENENLTCPIEDPASPSSSSSSDDQSLGKPKLNDSGKDDSSNSHHNTSTTSSPCRATERINKALEIIGSKLACNLDSDSMPTLDYTKAGEKTSEDSNLYAEKRDESSTTSASSPGFLTENPDDTLMSSVTPETNGLMISYRNVLEAEEARNEGSKSPDDSILDVIMSLSDTSHKEFQPKARTPEPDNEEHKRPQFISTLSESDYEDLSGKVPPKKSPLRTPPKSSAEVKKQRQSDGRIRRGSYSIEAPSPFLVSSKGTHTISSVDDTDNDEMANCEITEDSIFSNDVKRRLEMPSDSEESSISTTQGAKHNSSTMKLRENPTIRDYCKILEEQHRKEMLELQHQHEIQLAKFKEELLHGQSDTSSTLNISASIDKMETFSSTSIPKSQRSDFASRNCRKSQDYMNNRMHAKWCKLSALIKGYLTRRLLATRPVQNTMQTIRDTSRTILSMRSEHSMSSRSIDTMQDATLMNRLFAQLEAALYDFHEVFFETTSQDRMDLIAHSRVIEVAARLPKVEDAVKVPRLSAATLKSLQRKKSYRKSIDGKLLQDNTSSKHPSTARSPNQNKQVKSKISYIWKNDGGKKTNKGASKIKPKTLNPSKSRQPATQKASKKSVPAKENNNNTPHLLNRPLANGHPLTPSIR